MHAGGPLQTNKSLRHSSHDLSQHAACIACCENCRALHAAKLLQFVVSLHSVAEHRSDPNAALPVRKAQQCAGDATARSSAREELAGPHPQRRAQLPMLLSRGGWEGKPSKPGVGGRHFQLSQQRSNRRAARKLPFWAWYSTLGSAALRCGFQKV